MPLKGNTKVIAYLNEVLKAELTAINQYFLRRGDVQQLGLQTPLCDYP